MRCKNCGWENLQESLKCEKCNAPLSGSMVSSVSHNHISRPSEPSVLKGTIPEGQVFGYTGQSHLEINCCKCGYPLARGMNVCPNCGEPAGNPVGPAHQHGKQVQDEVGQAPLQNPLNLDYYDWLILQNPGAYIQVKWQNVNGSVVLTWQSSIGYAQQLTI